MMTVAAALALVATPGGATSAGDWDADADGVLEAAEFVAGLARLDVFSRFDADGDASLAAAEWRSLVNVADHGAADLDGDGAVDPVEMAAVLFARYDTDQSGRLDADEMGRIDGDMAEDGILSD